MNCSLKECIFPATWFQKRWSLHLRCVFQAWSATMLFSWHLRALSQTLVAEWPCLEGQPWTKSICRCRLRSTRLPCMFLAMQSVKPPMLHFLTRHKMSMMTTDSADVMVQARTYKLADRKGLARCLMMVATPRLGQSCMHSLIDFPHRRRRRHWEDFFWCGYWVLGGSVEFTFRQWHAWQIHFSSCSWE